MNKKKIIILLIFIILFVTILFIIFNDRSENIIDNEDLLEENEEIVNNSIMYEENSTLNELKEEYNITGTNEIYEIETEYDGRKVVNVKADINYKVAFCGMIKKSEPNFDELDDVFEKNTPKNNGIWINPKDYSKILSYLNNNKYTNCKYEVNEDGYLVVTQNNNSSEYDKIIEKLINNNKQYLLSISSLYYMVDTVSGQIVDNPYNELDKYQTYDYCNDNNKTLIFISENKYNKIEDDEIFISIIELLKTI